MPGRPGPDPSAPPGAPAFGDQLEAWLRSDGEKTIGSLTRDFGEKSFGAVVLVLMLVPALPLPTGGVSHLFEAVTMLVGAEMVVGRRTVWLPGRWRRHRVSAVTTRRAIPFVLRWIRRAEGVSRPRGVGLFASRWMQRAFGAIFVVLAGAAAVAPPFSGLDTLPAMGAVTLALAILFEDAVLVAVAVLVGGGGVALVLVAGAALVRVVERLF